MFIIINHSCSRWNNDYLGACGGKKKTFSGVFLNVWDDEEKLYSEYFF
jgi:hypothetical protein